MDLLVAYGLAERSPVGQRLPRRRVAVADSRSPPPGGRVAGRVALEVGEGDVVRWGEQLAGLRRPPRVSRPTQRRVWSREVLLGAGVRMGARRITIPILSGRGELRGVFALRLQPRSGAEDSRGGGNASWVSCRIPPRFVATMGVT